jgi:hypothetical protein
LIAAMPMRRSDDPAALVAAWRIAVAGFDPRDVMRGVIAVPQGRALDIGHAFAPSPSELARNDDPRRPGALITGSAAMMDRKEKMRCLS